MVPIFIPYPHKIPACIGYRKENVRSPKEKFYFKEVAFYAGDPK